LLETTLGKMVFTPTTPFICWICWKASVGRYGRLLTGTIQSRSASGADNATVDGDRGDPLCTIANIAPFCLGPKELKLPAAFEESKASVVGNLCAAISARFPGVSTRWAADVSASLFRRRLRKAGIVCRSNAS